MRLVHRYRLAELSRFTQEAAELELEVETLTRPENGLELFRSHVLDDLALGSHDWRTTHYDAGRPAVVSYWQVTVAGRERFLRASEEYPAVDGVVQTHVEVGVIANLHWEVVRHVVEGDKALVADGGCIAQHIRVGSVCEEERLQILADDGVEGTAERGEGVQGRGREDGLVRLDGRAVAEAGVVCEELKVEGMVADGDGGAGS